jgi:hypothetical protein
MKFKNIIIALKLIQENNKMKLITTLLVTCITNASHHLQRQQELQELQEYKHKPAHVSFEAAWEKRVQLMREKQAKNVCPKCDKSKNTISCILLH